VIFPLHSFGYSSRDFRIYNSTVPVYTQQVNFRVYAQTNSLERTIDNVLRYAKDIRLPNRRSIDPDLIRHYHRSRRMQWLERNPILLIAFRFSQWPARDNSSAIREQVRFTAIKLYFMKALSERASQPSLMGLFGRQAIQTIGRHSILRTS